MSGPQSLPGSPGARYLETVGRMEDAARKRPVIARFGGDRQVAEEVDLPLPTEPGPSPRRAKRKPTRGRPS